METRKPNKGMKIEEKERKAAGLDTAVLRERGKTALSVRSGFDRGFFWRFEKGRLVSPLCLYFGHSIEGILLLLLRNLFSASCLA